jgi:hypothetical protein
MNPAFKNPCFVAIIKITVKIKLTNSFLVLISLTALCFMSGCKHFNFDDPLTWRASLSGGHDIVGRKGQNTPGYNKERISLGISLEPDTTRVRIREEEASYKRRRLWEIEQAEERQKKLQIQQQQLLLQKQAETAKK